MTRANAQAREMVVSDPEILAGTPVIKGTQVSAYQVATAVAAGTPISSVFSLSISSLSREQVELAALYAEASPQRGRPRRAISVPEGATVISKRRKVLQPSV